MSDKTLKAIVFWLAVLSIHSNTVVGASEVMSMFVTPPNVAAAVLLIAYAVLSFMFIYALVNAVMYEKD
jgi:hypothetical protein